MAETKPTYVEQPSLSPKGIVISKTKKIELPGFTAKFATLSIPGPIGVDLKVAGSSLTWRFIAALTQITACKSTTHLRC